MSVGVCLRDYGPLGAGLGSQTPRFAINPGNNSSGAVHSVEMGIPSHEFPNRPSQFGGRVSETRHLLLCMTSNSLAVVVSIEETVSAVPKAGSVNVNAQTCND